LDTLRVASLLKLSSVSDTMDSLTFQQSSTEKTAS
jgi:hypothetical protein